MKRLQWLMSRYTGYVGVTNHMGAKFEATQDSLAPVLEEVKARGLLFVDDGSVQGSTGGQIASRSVSTIRLPIVQIDGDVAKGLAELETLAKRTRRRDRRRQAKPATIKQTRRMGREARSQGHRAGPGQRRDACRSAKADDSSS